MEFDKALEFAVTLAWNDLGAGDRLLSARVEYESKRGVPVDSLTVWTLRSQGYQDRVCDYWSGESTTHPAGMLFNNRYHSDTLAQALGFIMKNQDKFTHPPDAWRPHFVMIQPPSTDQVAQATAWMTGAPAGNRAAGPRSKPTPPQPGHNGTASHPPKTRIAADGPCPLVGSRSGFPNGPWCR